MIDKFNTLKTIVDDIGNIKLTLKAHNRRVKKLVCSYTAYEVLNKVSELVNKVLNSDLDKPCLLSEHKYLRKSS